MQPTFTTSILLLLAALSPATGQIIHGRGNEAAAAAASPTKSPAAANPAPAAAAATPSVSPPPAAAPAPGGAAPAPQAVNQQDITCAQASILAQGIALNIADQQQELATANQMAAILQSQNPDPAQWLAARTTLLQFINNGIAIREMNQLITPAGSPAQSGIAVVAGAQLQELQLATGLTMQGTDNVAGNLQSVQTLQMDFAGGIKQNTKNMADALNGCGGGQAAAAPPAAAPPTQASPSPAPAAAEPASPAGSNNPANAGGATGTGNGNQNGAGAGTAGEAAPAAQPSTSGTQGTGKKDRRGVTGRRAWMY